MSNLATLQTAPPFTTETARINSLKRWSKHRQNQKNTIQATSEDVAKHNNRLEIARMQKALAKLSPSTEAYKELAKTIRSFWSTCYSEQASVKPARSKPSQTVFSISNAAGEQFPTATQPDQSQSNTP